MTKRNIRARWAATDLFPFNPERVLRGIKKPPPQLSLPEANKVLSVPQEGFLRTHVMPMTTEALTSLHKLIKEDAVH